MKKGVKVYLSIITGVCLFAVGGAVTYKHMTSSHSKTSLGQLKKMQVALPKTITNTNDGHMIELTPVIQAESWSEVRLLKEEHSHVMDDLNMTVHEDTGSTFINNLPKFKSQLAVSINKLFPKGSKSVKVYLTNVIEQ